MDDLISRQAAIDAIMSVKRTDNIKSVAMLIMDLPSAEPQIIRCKDCKHLFNKDDEGGKCWHFNGFSKVVSYDDFCSCAERRTDG